MGVTMRPEDVREGMVFHYYRSDPTATFTVTKVKFKNGYYTVDLVDNSGWKISDHCLNNSILLNPFYYSSTFKDTQVPEIEWV